MNSATAIATGYHTTVRRKTGTPPPQGHIAARSALRVLALTIMERVDKPDADLWTLARQCEQVGQLAMAELEARAW